MTQVIEFLRIWYPIFLMLVIVYLSGQIWKRDFEYRQLKEYCDDQQRWIDNEMEYQEKCNKLIKKI